MWCSLCSTGQQFCLKSLVQEQSLKHLSIPESLSCSQAQLSLRKGLRTGQTDSFPSWTEFFCPCETRILPKFPKAQVPVLRSRPFTQCFPSSPSAELLQSLGCRTNLPSSLCYRSPQPHTWHWGFSLDCSQSSTFWVVPHPFSSNANSIGSLGTCTHSFH